MSVFLQATLSLLACVERVIANLVHINDAQVGGVVGRDEVMENASARR